MKSTLKRDTVTAVRVVSLLLIGSLSGACSIQPKSPSSSAPDLSVAETFVDAFYSFDPERLRSVMANATDSIPFISYYQGWAEGGNYEVLERKPCRFEEVSPTDLKKGQNIDHKVRCDVQVKDDLNPVLGTGYHVTDTFHLFFSKGRIVGVETSDNGSPKFEQALRWLHRERPEIFTGPCRGFYEGGPTPQECVRTVVKGFAEFSSRQRD